MNDPDNLSAAAGAPAVLVVNAGSSSLKMKLYPSGESVLVERVGGPTGVTASFALVESPRLTDAAEAFDFAFGLFEDTGLVEGLVVVGHRVVHGGTRFVAPTFVTEEVELAIAELAPLAPLHNPANLAALRAARAALPELPHVAVFDTAFHATLPEHAYVYGIPLQFAAEGLRRYGFHGISHEYVSGRAAELLGASPRGLKLITLHLGNGASAAAVVDGRSVDTSMGFTPLEGLLMGTRSGDIDPGLLFHLQREGMSAAALESLLVNGSGLKGMSGVSNDMRDVRAAAETGHKHARVALSLFAYRLRKLIGAYAAAMGGLDAVVFTGGIGENDPATRREATQGLGFLGIELDDGRNERGDTVISAEGSSVTLLVVRTDEEAMIAEKAVGVLNGAPREER